LDVLVGNDPALRLYQELGFEAFTKLSQYHYQKEAAIAPPALPAGYELRPLSRFDWRTRFALAKRITPEQVTRYEPVTEGRFRVPAIWPLFGILFETAGGVHSERFAIYASNEQVAAVGQYNYRTRAGGLSFVNVSVDPGHPQLADFVLRYTLAAVQKASPGHRVQLNFEDWQTALIEAAEALGCEKRFGEHHMGLKFCR
jgi:hypothetical protein